MRIESLFSLLSEQRRRILWLLAIASVAWFGYAADDLFRTERANKNIRELVSRHEVPIDPRRATPQEILARVSESVRRDHMDEAQSTLSIAAENLPAQVHGEALYNIANARTIAAGEAVRKGDLDNGAALINLAKSEYRLALQFDPENWDARYNMDVAQRIVRDLPLGDNPDTKSLETPKKLWTDLPGVPKGLP
jgi:mxaK protein